MKLFWTLAFVCAIMAATPLIAKSAEKPPGTLEQTAMANENHLLDAIKKDDGAFFQQTLAADFSMVAIDGKLIEGQEAADSLGNPDLLQLGAYNMKVVALGDAGAVVTYDLISQEKPQEDQGTPPRYQHASSVWVVQGRAWKLKFHQATAAHWGDW